EAVVVLPLQVTQERPQFGGTAKGEPSVELVLVGAVAALDFAVGFWTAGRDVFGLDAEVVEVPGEVGSELRPSYVQCATVHRSIAGARWTSPYGSDRARWPGLLGLSRATERQHGTVPRGRAVVLLGGRKAVDIRDDASGTQEAGET